MAGRGVKCKGALSYKMPCLNQNRGKMDTCSLLQQVGHGAFRPTTVLSLSLTCHGAQTGSVHCMKTS